ncbi:MAG: hypothetical protein ACFB21_02415 [Opitutales bacterium]
MAASDAFGAERRSRRETGPTGPAVALAALLCIQNHFEQFTDLSNKMV